MAAERTDQEINRRHKVEILRARGIEPFQSRFDRTHTISEALGLFAEAEREGSPEPRTERVALAGRIVRSREMGKATFADLLDATGRIQLLARVDGMGKDLYDRFTDLDLGDVIGVRGTVFRTRRGEITCEVGEFELLAKALRPLPEKWHGLQDVELRYRQRYLDLIANPQVKDVFLVRSRVIQVMRRYLDERGFIEVETPVLQSVPGGGMARPFRTHHNALDEDLYLRIALELHLKRLIVGGFDRVYEIGHVFRNEGVDRIHSPEYTMLELYQAYTDWNGMRELTEALVADTVATVHGGTSLTYQGETIEFRRPFARLEMHEAVSGAIGENVLELGEARLRAIGRERGIEEKPGLGWGGWLNELFEELIEGQLVQPTFVTGHPVEVSPLARRRSAEPRLTDRFELVIARTEIANAFSELNDPDDQRGRFEQQAKARAEGAGETHPMDEDFLTALEYGFPPTGGMGLGIDRLVAMLADQPSLRDVILFPHVRTKNAQP